VGQSWPRPRPQRGIVTRLNQEIVQILAQRDVEEKLTGEGAIPVGDSPEHFAGYIKTEIIKWGAVVKSANIKADWQ
jgi:tripartite-type tricarboxylate transporter receptor subunit TctC